MIIKLMIKSSIILENATENILARCIVANTFPNPAFESNELARRSNRQTNREIITYLRIGNSFILPRGFMRDLVKIFRKNNMDYEVIDDRVFRPCEYSEGLNDITFRPYQSRAIDEAMQYDQGVILSPTGSGKSFIGLEIAKRRGQKTLIIVHRKEIAKQWLDIIADRTGIKAGFIGDGKWNIGNEITVAMVQTLAAKKKEAKALSNAFGLILMDEVHHLPASTFFDTLGLFAAKFRYGLSATVERRDGLEKLIYLSVGPIISTITKAEVESIGATIPATIFAIQTGFNPGLISSWNEYLRSLSYNANRNQLIIDLAQKAVGSTLIIVDRISHAKQLSEMLEKRKIDHTLAHGQISKKDRDHVMKRIKSTKLTVGTSSLLGEGLDVSVWSTLVMGAPISSEIKLLQAIGRIVRPNSGKEKAIVYDLKDDCAFSGSSFNKRFEIYKKHKIWVNLPQEKLTEHKFK